MSSLGGSKVVTEVGFSDRISCCKVSGKLGS